MKKIIVIISLILFFTQAQLIQGIIPNIEFGNKNYNELENTYDDIIDMIDHINESLVFNYLNGLVSFGPRLTGSENCSRAAEYIYSEFKNMGLWVDFFEWSNKGFQAKNVVATINGTSVSDGIFIICAHYDTTRTSPGAFDDGSGVAAICALAKAMSKYSFNHTIRFIAFSGEEQGKYGSFCYAKDAYNRGDDIIAVLNLDGLGYAETLKETSYLLLSRLDRTKWLEDILLDVNEKYFDIVDMKVLPSPHYSAGDHMTFLSYGFDAIRFNSYNYDVSWKHTPEDNIEKINITYLTESAKLLTACLAELGNMAFDLRINIKEPYEGYLYFFDTPLIDISTTKFGYADLSFAPTVLIGRATTKVEIKSNTEIEIVYFLIDDKLSGKIAKPPYEWKIQGWFFPPLGRHNLVVYAYDIDGNFAKDEMDIFIFSLSTYWL